MGAPCARVVHVALSTLTPPCVPGTDLKPSHRCARCITAWWQWVYMARVRFAHHRPRNAHESHAQACVWTGDCDVPGCGSLCLANLTRVSAFATLEDAAWRPGWYELCPRLAELVAFFGAAAAAATPARRLQGGDGAPGLGGGHGSSAAAARRLRQAGGDVQLPCPSPEAVQAVAPIMQSQAQGWQTALAAAEAGTHPAPAMPATAHPDIPALAQLYASAN